MKPVLLSALLLLCSACVDDKTQIYAIDAVGGLPGRALLPDTKVFASPAYFRELRSLADIPDNAERDVNVEGHDMRIGMSAPRVNGLGNVCRNYRTVLTDVQPRLQSLPKAQAPVDTGRICRIEGEPWAVRRTAENG